MSIYARDGLFSDFVGSRDRLHSMFYAYKRDESDTIGKKTKIRKSILERIRTPPL